MEDELYHHGILGQKWGIRRYQNPDGSLTKAGEKRYEKLNSRFQKDGNNKSKSVNAEKASSEKPKPKSVHEMDDAELDAAINRMRSEKTFLQLQSELLSLKATPAKESKGKQATKEVWNVILKPGLENAGKKIFDSVLDKELKSLLGDMYTDKSYTNANTNAKKAIDKAKKEKPKFDD